MASKIVNIARLLVPKVPLLVSTTVVHYAYGPAKPSWSFRFSVTMALMRAFVAHLNEVPVSQSQIMSKMTDEKTPVNEGAIATEAVVSKHYRQKAAEIMERLLSLQGIDTAKLGWDWKNDPAAAEPLLGEWTEAKVKGDNYKEGRTVLYLHGGGYFLASIRTHRWATWHMARSAGAKVFCMSENESQKRRREGEEKWIEEN
jgi:acetyl esterase/lipase